jgi:hypothetical protein
MVEILINFFRRSDDMYCVYADATAATIHALAMKVKAVPYAVLSAVKSYRVS